MLAPLAYRPTHPYSLQAAFTSGFTPIVPENMADIIQPPAAGSPLRALRKTPPKKAQRDRSGHNLLQLWLCRQHHIQLNP